MTILNDTVVEPNETFGFIVQQNAGEPATTYLAKATFTIVNDDIAPVTWSVSPNPGSVNENAGSLTFTITRSSGATAQTVYVSTTQTEGYTNSGDYNGISSQALSFAAGETSKTVTVTILNDTVVEPNETFVEGQSNSPVGAKRIPQLGPN